MVHLYRVMYNLFLCSQYVLSFCSNERVSVELVDLDAMEEKRGEYWEADLKNFHFKEDKFPYEA